MTSALAPDPVRWGFCPSCERWRLTDAWERTSGAPRCPACGTPPEALETFRGSTGSLVLHLVARGPGVAGG